jgi:hypothetical protein
MPMSRCLRLTLLCLSGFGSMYVGGTFTLFLLVKYQQSMPRSPLLISCTQPLAPLSGLKGPVAHRKIIGPI